MYLKLLGIIGLVLLASYSAYDYGVKTTELAYAEANNEVVATAESARVDQVLTESTSVIASMQNAADRETQLVKLQKQVAAYEAELQKDRTVACNLSADTIASMQQFASPGNDSKQLGASAGISDASITHQPGSAANWQSDGNGRAVLRERIALLGYSLQSHRFATFYTITAKAGVAA